MNCADVWVVQCRRSFGFSTEALESLRISGEFLGKEFKGYETVEAGILRLIDDTHATSAEFLEDAVMRNDFAKHCLPS